MWSTNNQGQKVWGWRAEPTARSAACKECHDAARTNSILPLLLSLTLSPVAPPPSLFRPTFPCPRVQRGSTAGGRGGAEALEASARAMVANCCEQACMRTKANAGCRAASFTSFPPSRLPLALLPLPLPASPRSIPADTDLLGVQHSAGAETSAVDSAGVEGLRIQCAALEIVVEASQVQQSRGALRRLGRRQIQQIVDAGGLGGNVRELRNGAAGAQGEENEDNFHGRHGSGLRNG